MERSPKPPLPPRPCKVCGRQFYPRNTRQVTCSPSCSCENSRRASKAAQESHAKSQGTKRSGIFYATRKPAGCSDVRWRIELRRRRRAEYYDMVGAPV